MELTAVVLSVLVGSVLAALEGALEAFGEVRLLAAQEEGGRDGRTATRLLEEGPRLHTRIVTGRVLLLVVATALVLDLSMASGTRWFTPLALAALGLLYASLTVGVRALARTRATRWALPMARWLRPVELMVWPLAMPLGALVAFIEASVPPATPEEGEGEHAVRQIEHMIEQREESGSIPEEFAELLLSVLEFKDTIARNVMVPRTQMIAINIETSLDEVLAIIVESGHSRYPVYRGRADQIEGTLYAKDLFRTLRQRLADDDTAPALSEILRRPVFFVAETHKIGQLLREMQARRIHLAVVVDEFGGTSGIVTLEDIVEEIVGEIEDEHDVAEQPIEAVGEGRWLVEAHVSVYDLAAALETDLDVDGDFDSVGGMVVDLAGRVPVAGERITAYELEFRVRAADERHVTKLEVRRLAGPDPMDAAAE
ncbi:MAG: hemolysin family protein [Sandaracinaceae bacterium]